jgi:hypothetical protein
MEIKPQPYSFVTRFGFTAPVESVWNVLNDFHSWKKWWYGVRKVVVHKGTTPSATLTIGTLFYSLTFTLSLEEIIPQEKMIFVSTGDLAGTGRFEFQQTNKYNTLAFYWDVVTTKPWMNMLAPVLRPFFTKSHTVVMYMFVHGLAKEVGTRAQDVTYTVHKPVAG